MSSKGGGASKIISPTGLLSSNSSGLVAAFNYQVKTPKLLYTAVYVNQLSKSHLLIGVYIAKENIKGTILYYTQGID